MQRLIIVGLVIGCCGCDSHHGVRRAAVRGKVTLDGEAIREGSIAFYPSGDAKGPVAGGTVENGRYSIPGDSGPVIGSNRVEIHAWRKTGRKVQMERAEPGTLIEEMVDVVPQRYFTSPLMAEIRSGKNTFDFELTSR
ncbi:MAG: hypothetical protein RBS80_29990 [Thermoguttaceae bacterium]|jgi:hypothetical protein|nr:hypothetical protein [Thermoguttaceae bacterium]